MENPILPKFIVNDFKMSFWGKLLKFTPLHLHSMLTDKSTNKWFDLPVKIEHWRLIKDFQPEKPYPFKIGLYRDKKGNKVVAKVWKGRFKNIHYGNMVNEIVATHTLSSLGLRLRKSMDSQINTVKTPGFIKVIKKPGKLIFMEEYLTGTKFADLDEAEKIKVYKKVKQYFKFLSKNLTSEDSKLIRVATYKEISQRYPLILIAALLRRPYLWRELLEGLVIFIKGARILKKTDNYSIVHGDINYDNILVDGDNISIIDVEQLMYTLSDFEDVTSLSTARNSDSFTSFIIESNLEKCLQDKEYAHLFSMLLVYCETYNLTGSSSPISLKNHIRRLKLGLSIYKSTHEVSSSLQKDKRYILSLINSL